MKNAMAALLLGALGGAMPAANAIEFNQVLADKSALTFVSKQMNVPVEGRFKSFRGKLAFDPAKPAAASAELEIDLASVDAGSKDANDELAGKVWFNTKVFPVAKFVLTSVKPLGENRYEVAGKMTIKGKTQDLTAPSPQKRRRQQRRWQREITVSNSYGMGERSLW